MYNLFDLELGPPAHSTSTYCFQAYAYAKQ